MKKTLLPQIIIIVLVVASCVGWSVYRYQTDLDTVTKGKKLPINLGLDLKGGVHMIIECHLPKIPTGANVDVKKQMSDKVQGVMKVMQNRIDPGGVKEIAMQIQGERYISIDIPGANNPDEVKKIVGQTALLEFIHVGSKSMAKGEKVPESARNTPCPEHFGPGEMCRLMTGSELVKADPDIVQGEPSVDFELSKTGGEIFYKYTRSHVNQYLAIVLDGIVLSSPVIKEGIYGGKGRISGGGTNAFTSDEVSNLATWLNSGALPVPVSIAEVRTVSPTLGKDSLNMSMFAGLIGFIIVMLFMAAYYKLPGLIADFALCLYIVIMFGIMSIFNFTLTLPGIAGFILSVGMAVDANIIIFERLKEELRSGKTLKAAMDAGFTRAFNAILDSNVTTVIASIVLIIYGTGSIRGFGVTLTIGVITSMFSAITISRTLLLFVIDAKSLQNHSLYGVKSKAVEA